MLVDMNNVGVTHSFIGHLQTPNARKRLSGPDYDVRQTTGAFGFRNPGPWPARADVVILGDSLVFGYGVADGSAWPAIVDRSFPGLKVVNLGLVGAGAEQYLRVYQTFGERLRPKVVVVGMFPGNDFWDAGQFQAWLREGGQGNYMVWRNYGRFSGNLVRQPKRAAKSLLLRHSYLYNLILAARSNHEAKQAGEPKIVRLKGGQEIRLLPSDFRSRTAGSQAGRPEFQLTVRALKELRNRVEKAGGRLVVVLQPSKEEIYLPLLGERVRDASAALRPALRELGIEYLDLAPGFRREADTGKALFFGADGHPNQAGYRLIADQVIDYLQGRIRKADSQSTSGSVAWPRLDSPGGVARLGGADKIARSKAQRGGTR